MRRTLPGNSSLDTTARIVLTEENKMKILLVNCVRKSILIVFVSFLFLSTAYTQNSDPMDPKRGVNKGASYSLSDIENINLTNGNLMLNMPLATLPRSRGGMSGSMGWVYNSKLYRTEVLELYSDITSTLTDQNVLAPSEKGGWQFVHSLQFYFKPTNRFSGGEIPCAAGDVYAKNSYRYKVQVGFPDGSEKEFVPVGESDAYDDDFYNISPNGLRLTHTHNLIGEPPSDNCQSSTGGSTTNDMVYQTIDGTYLRMVVDHDSDYDDTNNAFAIYFPDGSYYESSNKRLTDRYGNYIEETSFTYNSKNAYGIEDSLGRKIFYTAGDSAGEMFVYQLGVGGDPVKWTVRGKNNYVRREYRTTGAGGLRDRGGSSEQVAMSTKWVLDEVELPSELGGQKFEFEYSSSDEVLGSSGFSDGWGEITKITLPSGAYAEYEFNTLSQEDTDEVLSGSVSKKTLNYVAEYDGNSTPVEEVWEYGITPIQGTVISPDGSIMTQTHGNTSYNEADSGLVKSIENANGTKVEKIWAFDGTSANGRNPYVNAEFTSIKNSSGTYTYTAIKTFTQDRNGNTTSVKEYDFVPYGDVPRTNYFPTGLPSGIGNPTRATYTEYYNATPDASNTTTTSSYDYWKYNPVKNVAKSVEIKNSSNQTVSKTEFTYDNYSTTANPTLTRTWDSVKGSITTPLTDSNSVKSQATYNSYGMPLTSTDANGNVTQITYGNVSGPSGNVTDLYPTQTIAAYGTGLARTSTAVYDFYTGLVTSTTDEDNDVTNAMVYDDLGRPIKAITAEGATGFESWTQTIYDDEERRVIVKSDLETKGDYKRVAIQHFDQLGRVRLSRTLEDSATEDPTDEEDGIKVQTRYSTTYSSPNGYTYQIASNPYRASTSSAASSEPTMGWTRSKAWHTGIKQEVETFSGSALPAPWGSNTTSTGKTITDIDANATTVTDQAGKVRRSITNALGQLTRVDEPNGSNVLGSVSSPNQATYYSYNTIGKMVHVEQGAQHRYFMYDSLGRLLRVKQPEQTVNTLLNTSGNPDNNSWTAGFTYDKNGNVLTATDAKNLTITSTYDELNRVEQRSYNDSPQTPTVNFYYDGAGLPSVPDFSKGKLTKVTNSVSESRYTEFDVTGQLLEYKQITDGQTYTSSYEYNLAGALTKETYPSGRTVENQFDANGDVSRIFGKATSTATERTFANAFTYTPDGKIEKLRLGNGLWEAAVLNSRSQVTQFTLGHGSTSGDLWKLNIEYGDLQTNGTVDSTKNSGNIGKQTLTFNGLANPFIQTFKYDPLYRLTEARETNNSNQTWKQVFDYDRYGNRTTYEKYIGTTQETLTTEAFPEIDDDTNRIAAGEGYTFDANGNVVVDAQGRQFTFNGDNKQTKVEDDEDNDIGEYYYDGEGKRIKKVVGDETTIFVYSGSKLTAEYSTETPPTSPTTSYTITDQLGSPRIIVDGLGQVVSRRDFMPFGEEVATDGTYRTTAKKYGQEDQVRQRFTGYQKDEETGLDFAEARMYQNLYGRFTAVDPLMASGKSADPQSFNRYIYVLNNPLVLADPLGLQSGTAPDVKPCDSNKEHCDGTYDKKTNTVSGMLNITVGPEGETSDSGLASQVGKNLTQTFLSGFSQSISEQQYGAAITLPNIGIGLANLATQGSMYLQYGSAASMLPNPFAIESYPITSPEAARMTVGLNVGLMFAPSAAAAPFSAASSLSVVPEISAATRTPAFLGQANGPAIAIPEGATATSVLNRNGNVTGFAYTGGSGGNGLNDAVTGVRIMNPTSRYPNGYVTYMGNGRQGVNPITGRTIPNSDPMRHIRLNH